MVDFPIPSALAMLSGIGDKKMGGKIRTTVDVGPAIQRRRYTATVRKITVPCILTNAERITFEAFYDDDILSGTLAFNWIDPLNGTTVSMRFADDDGGPDWTQVNGGDVTQWSATLNLEILP